MIYTYNVIALLSNCLRSRTCVCREIAQQGINYGVDVAASEYSSNLLMNYSGEHMQALRYCVCMCMCV